MSTQEKIQEKIVVLTQLAASRMRNLLQQNYPNPHNPHQGLRLSLKKGGCAGMSYNLAYTDKPDPKDIVQQEQDILLYIDPFASMFLLGTTIDFEQTPLSNGFTFQSPKATGACGCGESVTFK